MNKVSQQYESFAVPSSWCQAANLIDVSSVCRGPKNNFWAGQIVQRGYRQRLVRRTLQERTRLLSKRFRHYFVCLMHGKHVRIMTPKIGRHSCLECFRKNNTQLPARRQIETENDADIDPNHQRTEFDFDELPPATSTNSLSITLA